MMTTKPMQVDLEGRHALVTGGGTGIGRSLSLALARCGATVVVNYSRSADAAEDTAAQIANLGGRAMAIRADVTDESQVRDLVQKAVQAYGGIDLVVANAGGPTEICPTHELSGKEWERGLGLNCRSVFYCVKHTIPLLPNHSGKILVTSSISARSGGGPGMITYAAAKGALNNMVRGWAKELAPRGITVNAIAPGVIWTRIHEKNTNPEEYKKLIQRIPLGRDGTPDDCVGAVLLLAAPEGSYITGQIIEINGGMQMP
jgi:3-oxoacyl-[acyl-carrier protein] reductase